MTPDIYNKYANKHGETARETEMSYPIAGKAHKINGVPGLMYPIHEPQKIRGRLVHRNQKWVSEARPISGYGTDGKTHVNMQFDDECMNGHQTFSITASIYTSESRWLRDIAAGGSMHDEIKRTFPELAPFVRWHLVSTDGPMHYVANTIYHAGDRDLDAARSAACWPDATDEELTVEPEILKAALLARLPGLIREFRADMEKAGFLWEPERAE